MQHFQLHAPPTTRRFTISGLALLAGCLLLQSAHLAAAPLKPRIVVLTDISTWEPDDHESLIRLLAHADLFEIEGLVISTGWSIQTLTKSPEKDFINIARGVIDAYEKDLPNLLKRSGQAGHRADETRQEIGYWPSPGYLKERTMFGSLNRGRKYIGDDNNSPGSELIITLADEEDPRPLWVLAWGGGNTVAQSIYRVKKDRSPAQFKAFLHKLRIYTITDQDRHYRGEGLEISSHGWMREQAGGELFFIWDECAWKGHNGTGKSNWDEYATHIQGHGNLGAQYPKYKYGVEGDTPSFLYLMPNGLNDPEDPTQCSWGGTFKSSGAGLWQPADSCWKDFQHFYPAAFNNFAARMDWAKDGAGNRNPVVVLDGDDGIGVLTRTPNPGSTVTLDASKTRDPDGDKLQFRWWVQPDAGSYSGKITLSGEESSIAQVRVPADAAGKTFHVICEVTDDGTHNLSAYRRIIFKPTSQPVRQAKQATGAQRQANPAPSVPAFPGAEGYGAVARGGRGGRVIPVTNLNPSGPGSLQAACDAEGPRIVIFRVSGIIDGDVKIKNDHITIAGQTAPGDGITIKGNLAIGANDVVIRYIRVRTDHAGDALGGRYRKNIILDHVSASWSSDEVLSLYHNENVTIQWCMITEACAKADGSHRFGGIWGNQYGTYHHNLIAHNDSRNPRWASGCGFNDYRNNVLYNWGYESSYGGEAHQKGDRRKPPIPFSTINMVANYYKPGPATRSNVRARLAKPSARGSDDKGSWYVAENYVDGSPEVTADNWRGVHGTAFIRLAEPWKAMPIRQQSPRDAYLSVLGHAGCSLPRRDSIDARIIEEVRTGTATHGRNGIITTQDDVGGWPKLQAAKAPKDLDNDGMPDEWEMKCKLNPQDGADGAQDKDRDGYTNVEEYLNGTDPTVFVDYTRPENNLNTLQ